MGCVYAWYSSNSSGWIDGLRRGDGELGARTGGEKRNRKEKKQNNGETFTQGSSGEALGEIVSSGGAPTPPQLPCSAWA